jgi:hypothetical protein
MLLIRNISLLLIIRGVEYRLILQEGDIFIG